MAREQYVLLQTVNRGALATVLTDFTLLCMLTTPRPKQGVLEALSGEYSILEGHEEARAMG